MPKVLLAVCLEPNASIRLDRLISDPSPHTNNPEYCSRTWSMIQYGLKLNVNIQMSEDVMFLREVALAVCIMSFLGFFLLLGH